MSTHNTGRRILPGKATKGLFIQRDILESTAWWSLSGSSMRVFQVFLMKQQKEKLGQGRKEKWVPVSNQEIEFTYSEATDKLKMNKNTFTKAIRQLRKVGLIDTIKPSAGPHQATLYGYSDRWRKYGTPEFVEVNCEPCKRFQK